MAEKKGTQNKTGDLHRQADEALRQVEGKYRSLVETAGAGIAIIDLEGKLTFVNDRLCLLSGYSREELIGKPFAGFIHEDDLPHLEQAFVDAVAGVKRSGMLEFRLVCRDSRIIWAHGNPQPEVIGAKISGFNAIIYDITNRKRLEEELRESEAQFSATLENAPDGVYMNDLEGNFLYGNRRCEEIIGYKREELIGKNFLELNILPENSLARAAEILQDNINGKSTGPDELELISRDGRRVPAEINTSVIQRGGKKVVLAFVRDITGRKMVERALSEQERAMRTMISNLPGFVYRCANDRNWTMVFISDGCLQVTGYAPDDFIGNRNLAYNDIVYPDYQEMLWEKWQALLDKRQVFEEEYPITARNGETRWVWERGQGVFSEDGRLLYLEGFITDVTERRRVADALQESEGRFRRLSENAPDVVFRYRVKPVRCFEYISPAVTKLSGYAPEEYYADPLLARKIVHPEDRNRYEQHFRSMEPSGKPLILRYLHKAGHVTWAEEIDVPVYDVNGQLIAYEGIVRDVTERRQAEDAVRESEKRFKSIIEHITDIFFILNSDYEMLYISPQADKVLGYTVDELRNNWRGYVTDNPINTAAYERTQLAITTGEKQEPYLQEFMHRDGTKRMVEINESPLKNDQGEVIGIVGAIRDVTERKRIESALIESEEKYRLVVENSLESIYIAVDGILRFGNSRAAELSGYSQEELVSRPFIEFIHPDDRQMVVERYLQRLKGMDVPGVYSFRLIDKSGNTRWVELSAVLITWEGRPATLNFLTDVTDRRRLEEERQRVEKLESVGLLAAGIAHDFNNILTAILGNISLAGTEAAPGSELHNSLEQAEKASLRARELTQQLLTFSKGGAPVTKLASLTELLKDTIGFALRGSNVKSHFSLPPDLWHAEIDTGQVSQIIHNLVINAQQAMPAGGSIEICAENMAISKKQSLGKGLPLKEGNYVRVTVADHGSGIPAEYLEKIFDPFFTTKKVGSGLGLATSFSIARQHGGHLTVESEPGRGSTFYLYLPASTQTAAPKPARAIAGKPTGKDRILVMDDEQGVRDIAGRLLNHIGYTDIEFAADGAAAIKLYKAAMKSGRPFAVAILDLTIAGGMGGEEAIKKLLKIDPGVRAIVSSGYADDPVMAAYRNYGFSGMVAKPYSLTELGKAMHDVTG